MTIEAGAVIALDGERVIHWHAPSNRTAGSLPDSRELWDIFFRNWNTMAGFAHSHPFHRGFPEPSMEDLTTFYGVETGLGRRYKWWITSLDRLVVFEWRGPAKLAYTPTLVEIEPAWVHGLRQLSGV
jgi:hypothetical protein